MPRRLKRKARSFDLYVQDMMLRVTAPEELYEEARVAAMSFSECATVPKTPPCILIILSALA